MRQAFQIELNTSSPLSSRAGETGGGEARASGASRRGHQPPTGSSPTFKPKRGSWLITRPSSGRHKNGCPEPLSTVPSSAALSSFSYLPSPPASHLGLYLSLLLPPSLSYLLSPPSLSCILLPTPPSCLPVLSLLSPDLTPPPSSPRDITICPQAVPRTNCSRQSSPCGGHSSGPLAALNRAARLPRLRQSAALARGGGAAWFACGVGGGRECSRR